MSKEQYLRMCEQTGQEIDWDKCPPGWEDFPEPVTTAIEIFHQLGDRVYADVGFVGKDFTNLDFLFRIHYIKDHQKEYLLELLLFLEREAIQESQRAIKSQMAKIKKK